MNASQKFHKAAINCFILHHEQNLVVSGDLNGQVFYSNYMTGEIGGLLGSHADSVESLAFCKVASYTVSCGIDPNINIYFENSLRQ